MTPDQKELMRWLGEFNYNWDFCTPERKAELLRRLVVVHDARELLLACREHIQGLLTAIQHLEKIVG